MSRNLELATHLPVAAGCQPRSRRSTPAAIWLKHAGVMLDAHLRFLGMMSQRLLRQNIFWQPQTTAAELDRGLTIILPGIEASGPFVEWIYDGLRDGRINGAVKIFYWGIPFPEGYFPNLMHERRNRSKAAQLADMICRHRSDYPGSPIHLVAHSGGAGPAVFAIEQLPSGVHIDGLALLGGAISRDYDLRPILKRTRKGILNSYSPKDWFVLGLGTQIFGTSDRKFTESCGWAGFTPAHCNSADSDLFAKLEQIAWTPDMINDCDYWGNHGTTSSRELVAKFITPWINQAS
ncbi:MAG: hypothetical protein HKL96_00645 [Phycisphaerales bacterium]|nr:hypothetical protein [Phycisphaerales bacterium]